MVVKNKIEFIVRVYKNKSAMPLRTHRLSDLKI